MLDESGSLVWRILFGVVMAALLIGIFLAYSTTQKQYRVGEEAQTLANSLSKTAFSTLPKKSQTFNLYKSVGGANYELKIENQNFVVKIIGGRKGAEYKSGIGAKLEKRGTLPDPGGKLYLRGQINRVIVSSSPIEVGVLPEPGPTETYQDNFYENLAKENPRTASGIIASYYYARNNYPDEENLDVEGYFWKSKNELATLVSSDENFSVPIVLRGVRYENTGKIDNSWAVENHIIGNAGGNNFVSCPSIANAHRTGWVYSPERVINLIQSRNWVDSENNNLGIPNELDPKASAVTTDVSTYPTWRFKFESGGDRYTFYFSAIPWKYSENTAGFVYESVPELRVVL